MKRCRLCRDNNLEQLDTEKGNYYFCCSCHLISVAKEDILLPAEQKKRYLEHNNTHENEGYVKMFERFIAKVIQPHVFGVENVLEFGCGPGPVLADLLKERGFKVDIYDPFFYPREVFRKRKYGLITATEVFEHLERPDRVLKMLVDHLIPGGFLAVMTSFHPGPEKFPEWWYKWDPTHIIFFDSVTFDWIADNYFLEKVKEAEDKYCLFKKK
ncbi:MAG: class I SAM-dependent methyltransferase [Halanaerobiaceae bacterium]